MSGRPQGPGALQFFVVVNARLMQMTATKVRRRTFVCVYFAAIACHVTLLIAPRVSLWLEATTFTWAIAWFVVGNRYYAAARDATLFARRREASIVAYRFVVLSAALAFVILLLGGFGVLNGVSTALPFHVLIAAVGTGFVVLWALPAMVYAWNDPT